MRALTPTQSTLQQIVKENSPHTNTQDTIYDIDTMSFLRQGELTSLKHGNMHSSNFLFVERFYALIS